MKAGRLAVKIHDAEYCSLLDQGDEVFCAAHIDEYGKLCTEARTCEQPMTFHEELTFKIGPPEADGHPLTLQLMLFKQQGDEEDRQLLGMGSMLLEGLEEGDKLSVKVPLVDKIGKHSGDVSATCRYFPSRCVGKSTVINLEGA